MNDTIIRVIKIDHPSTSLMGTFDRDSVHIRADVHLRVVMETDTAPETDEELFKRIEDEFMRLLKS